MVAPSAPQEFPSVAPQPLEKTSSLRILELPLCEGSPSSGAQEPTNILSAHSGLWLCSQL